MKIYAIIPLTLLLFISLEADDFAEKKNTESETSKECPAKCREMKINKNVNMVDKVIIVVSSPAELHELVSKGVAAATADVTEQNKPENNKPEDPQAPTGTATEKSPTASKPMFVSNIDLMRNSAID